MQKGHLTTRPGQVALVVHPLIATPQIANPSADDAHQLASRIEAIVRSALG